MKTEGNDLAHSFEEVDSSGGHYHTHYGLTKREYFSAMAMQGLLTNAGNLQPYEKDADLAVSMADALITSLNKKTE